MAHRSSAYSSNSAYTYIFVRSKCAYVIIVVAIELRLTESLLTARIPIFLFKYFQRPKCAYVIIFMAILLLTGALHIAVTSRIPIFLLNYFQRSKCGYVVIVMAILWLTEALPMAITSLIPVSD